MSSKRADKLCLLTQLVQVLYSFLSISISLSILIFLFLPSPRTSLVLVNSQRVTMSILNFIQLTALLNHKLLIKSSYMVNLAQTAPTQFFPRCPAPLFQQPSVHSSSLLLVFLYQQFCLLLLFLIIILLVLPFPIPSLFGTLG